MRRFLFTSLFIGLSTIIGCFAGLQLIDDWAETKIMTPGEITVELKAGMSLKSLSTKLADGGVIDNELLFSTFMRLRSNYSKAQAGTYLFKGEMSPQDVIKKMMSGDVYIPVVLQVTIPEGFTLRMLNERLAAKNVGLLSDLEKLVRDQKFIRSLGIKSATLEGFTFPATYAFDVMPDARTFYKETVKTFFEKLPNDYESDISKQGLNLTQAVTFASLIELETMRDEEKPMISEVIWARLKKGEPLGIDAAIIYGISNYDGDLKWKDLKNAKNPYNTRIHRGLPPGPIGAASTSSLVAVLNPSKLGYYYYVVDSTDPTRHVFAKTMSEHNANVRKFLKSTSRSAVRKSNGKEGER